MATPAFRRDVEPRTSDPSRRSSGQAIVELALILPILLLLLLAIGDFARLYTTALTVESAVREAADYGAFQGSNWLSANIPLTEAGMYRRACTASNTLPDYQTSDPDNTCENPVITYELVNDDGINCAEPVPAGDLPCIVHVSGHYDFHLFLGGVGIAGIFSLPGTIPIDRDASYVVNDFPAP